MKTLACIATTGLALWLGSALAQEAPAAPPVPASAHAAEPSQAQPQFEQLDADADRVLTLEEVPAGSVLHRDFARWDANKDGVLNLPEFERHVGQIAQTD